MVGMPYHLEKGPWLSVLEDYLNGEEGRSLSFLYQLRANREEGARLADLPFLATPALNEPVEQGRERSDDAILVDERRAHLHNDWFGGDDNRAGFVNATLNRLAEQGPEVRQLLEERNQIPEDPSTSAAVSEFASAVIAAVEETPTARLSAWPATGFWFQYHGDVETILRETLIRTIEVSLGLGHEEEPKGQPDRRLPIELFWKCPQRWFEGWISWRWDRAHGIGQVTSILSTPGSGKPILDNPTKGKDATQPTGSTFPPSKDTPLDGPVGPGPNHAGAEQYPKGMWVISHIEHAQVPTTPNDGATPSGQWAPPSFGPTCVGVGPVVCVQPSEEDGGVNPFGHAYIPPSASMAS